MDALHKAIVCVDVEGFGDRCRTNPDQLAVRDVMYRTLRRAFDRSGVPRESCYTEDRGDGVLVLVDADVPKERLAGPLPKELAAELDRHNRGADRRTRVRLRLALHGGEIHQDEHGVTGASLNQAFRLLEAARLKAALRGSSSVLGLVASPWIYEEVIRHCPGSGPDAYLPIDVEVKETRTGAWMRLFDAPSAKTAADGETGRRAPEAVEAAPCQLPGAARDFVGRAEEVASLTRLLDESAQHGAPVIAVITGTAGVGKTALAVHWGRRMRHGFPDGQLYVNLRGHDREPPMPPEDALTGMLHTLGVATGHVPTGVEQQAALFRSLLEHRRVLVVLDNADTAEQVRPLLAGAPGCMVLVTSRNSLGGLIARDGAHAIGLDRPTEAEALTLLRRIIGDAQVDAEPAAAMEVVRRCACLPLALRVAAERVATRRHVSLTDVAEELADERDRLDVLDATDDEFSAVRTVFSWSYCALPAETARVFRLLVLHPGPDIGIHAAAALADGTPDQTRRLLNALVRVHLLEECARDRYRFHNLLRIYARERAHQEETQADRSVAVHRMLGWYLNTADAAAQTILSPAGPSVALDLTYAASRPLTFAGKDQARRWCEVERVNLLAATCYAHETGHHDIACRLPAALFFLDFHRHSPWLDWIFTYNTALDSARQVQDRHGEAYTLAQMGGAYYDLGRFQDSADRFSQALAIVRDVGDRWAEGSALHGLALAYRGLKRFEESVELYQQALSIFRDIGDKYGQGWSLTGLGYAHAGLRAFDKSLRYFRQALTITRCTDPRTEGWALIGLGYAFRCLGSHTESLQHCERALAIFLEVRDWAGQGEALFGIGVAQHKIGHTEAARESWTRALSLFQDARDSRADKVRAHLGRLRGDAA